MFNDFRWPKSQGTTGSTTFTGHLAILHEFAIEGIDPGPIQLWAAHTDRYFCRNRHQAIVAFPIFAMLIVQFPDVPIHKEIEAAIDRGDPLVAALSSRFSISKRIIRLLRGKKPCLIGRDWLTHPFDLLTAVAMIPSEKLPRTPDEWRQLRHFWQWCVETSVPNCLFRQLRAPLDDPISRHMLVGLCSAGYAVSSRRVRKLLGESQTHPSTLSDYFDFVFDWCMEGTGIRQVKEITGEMLRDELLTHYSALELIRQSEQWHRVITQLSAAERYPEKDEYLEQWPSLPGLPLRVNELTVVSLTNPIALHAEGCRLNHCVGSYFRSCVLGHSHIVSVRNSNGDSLSTAEIYFRVNEVEILSVTVAQHQGTANSDPEPRCSAALNAALAILRSTQMRPMLSDIQTFHVRRREQVRAMLRCRGSGYRSETLCKVMRKVLRDYERVIAWLDQRIAQEEDMYRYHNDLAEERQRKLGFDGELTWEKADEIFRDTGNESCFEEGIVAPRSIAWVRAYS